MPLRQVLHPVLPVTRGPDGALLDIGSGSLRESMMRISFAGADSGGPETEALIAATLADVRMAVEDFPPMLAELRAAQATLSGTLAILDAHAGNLQPRNTAETFAVSR